MSKESNESSRANKKAPQKTLKEKRADKAIKQADKNKKGIDENLMKSK